MAKFMIDVWVVPAKAQIFIEGADVQEAMQKAITILGQGNVQFRPSDEGERITMMPHELTDEQAAEIEKKIAEQKAQAEQAEKPNLILPNNPGKLILPGGN